MKTCDNEFVAAATAFIKQQHAAGTPFFVSFNSTHMHFRTYVQPGTEGQAGLGSPPITTP